MSIHKLTAGSGYDYLTRQVAALDATEKGHVPLASYYTERGESPGVWIGSGLAGIDGLKVGDPVTAVDKWNYDRGRVERCTIYTDRIDNLFVEVYRVCDLRSLHWLMRIGGRPVTSTHTGAGEPVAGVWRGGLGCHWIVATSTRVCVLAEVPPDRRR